ncbi:PAP2-domain-containing protein [Daldinia vernicosa]|uniref:PAP2-domain-containing protein n=1 Tax=Daldinia vernicosa TaxID=114800 RepID=UPI0020073FA1|nr:PAP2-domain-containing protein [Daldinia vernicosa]KAI0853866.1 PAP2-domain-containing protein [Daldinia vernicosa]
MNITNHVHANGGVGPLKSVEDVEEKPPVIDAGLRSLDHYKRALPKWRYELRQRALPLVRWETPYLAWLQATLRSPALDSYFAITANLGTHTFFMIGLPIMFWCGNASFGKGIVHILATGVFFTGFVKDFFSLPRPLSPPLHRITMSGSAALEYGFPSTHSANAVSVAVYAILCLHDPDNPFQPATRSALEALAYFYAISIVFGRLYCGMHGFVDVIIGSLMGAIISLVEFYGGPVLDLYLEESWTSLCGLLLLIIILIRVHPEPADDCPCFDDSVAFAGVMMGLEIGTWRFARSSWADIPFDAVALGWAAVALRILFGVLVIFAWREVAKPALLKGLPHLFRLIEIWGLILPRRFFMPASEYKNIPLRLRVDNVMPNVSDLPNLITAVRHPGRGRSVSVGPQSAADAYETLAYRERRRRESVSVGAGNAETNPAATTSSTSNGVLRNRASVQDIRQQDEIDNAQSSAVGNINGAHTKPSDYEKLMGEGTVVISPAETGGEPDLVVGQHDELGEKEVFSKLVKPRVRYDVEVVTKLVVYCGIGWLAVEIVPVLYEVIPGLGASHLRVA